MKMQFPLFQFTLPVELHQRRKCIKIKRSLAIPVSYYLPTLYLGLPLLVWPTYSLHWLNSFLYYQRPLLPAPQKQTRCIMHTSYTLHPGWTAWVSLLWIHNFPREGLFWGVDGRRELTLFPGQSRVCLQTDSWVLILLHQSQ